MQTLMWMWVACEAGPEAWLIDEVAPFDGQTAWGERRPIVVTLTSAMTEEAVGMDRGFALFGDAERIPIVDASLVVNELTLLPERAFAPGVDYRLFFTGDATDTPNFADVAVLVADGFEHARFQVESAPRPVCRTWFEADSAERVGSALRGRHPCVGFSEPLVPGWVDLPRGAFRADGDFLKSTGLVPDADPWLLCALIPSDTLVEAWALHLEDAAVVGQAGGALDGDGDGEPGANAYIISDYLPDCPIEAPSW